MSTEHCCLQHGSPSWNSHQLWRAVAAFALCFLAFGVHPSRAAKPGHIVLVMADDQGWGETGYNGHPLLKTPHLDQLANSGLQLNRFYAGAPVCSPTRATVLTGRSNNRTGVATHGHALRLQERTISQALARAGYTTGHFGKWHLNGLRGPGVPILASDSHHPGVFGFEHWLSVTNFFDRDPILSRLGNFEEHTGDSSEIVVEQALRFIEGQVEVGRPTFSVIWFGTPHAPFRATDEDALPFTELDKASKNHFGELVAMDRAVGRLRARLRELGVASDTLLWFCSDNGGLPKIQPSTVGQLRGFKGSLYEGGLRVPCVIEWPGRIEPRASNFPASTMDIAPTLAALTNLPHNALLEPVDGISLATLFSQELPHRDKPIPFHCFNDFAMVDNEYKLLRLGEGKRKQPGAGDNAASTRFELYHLGRDPSEEHNLLEQEPEVARRMCAQLVEWQVSLQASMQGSDYPEGKLDAGHPASRFWTEEPAYQAYFDDWRGRPEYQGILKDK